MSNDDEIITIENWRFYNGCRIVGTINDGNRDHSFATKALFAVDVPTRLVTEIGGRTFRLGKPWSGPKPKASLWNRITALLKGEEDHGTTELEEAKATVDKLRGREPVRKDEAGSDG